MLNRKAWSNYTHSGEAAQARDVINALECLILPPHVLRDQDVPSKPIYIRKVFAPGVPGLLPHPSPGFPQWALPELAVNGFRFSQLTPPNTSLLQYLVTMRSVMSEFDVKPSCVPPNVPSELDFTTSAATRCVRAHNEVVLFACAFIYDVATLGTQAASRRGTSSRSTTIHAYPLTKRLSRWLMRLRCGCKRR